ncbi:MAG: restriction endonuclease subunit S [Bacteroidetes bacterium]|nr:restriction endonuclease subunit S [Bacteroidota bacterium]
MSKTKKILPELRFPEFSKNETWADRKLSDVLFEHKEKSIGDEEVHSVSVHKGVVNQIEHLGRVFAASNTENYKRVLPGDIIYTKSPTGDFPFGIIKQSKVSKPVIVSPLYGVFKPETTDLGVILDAYFEYPERTVNYLSSIVQKGAKNTINIHNDIFLSKSLVLPLDKREQRKIASCIISIDEVIAIHIEKLELLNEHKKGLIQNLFPIEGERVPKYRFKDFKKDDHWEIKELNELGDLINGLTYSPTDVRKDGLLVLRSSNIQNGMIDLKDCVYVRTDIKGANLSKPNDILVCVRNGSKALIGKNAIISKNVPIATHGAFMTVFRTKIPEFVFQLFQTDLYNNQVMAGLGATINSINGKDLLKYKFPIPKNPREQQKIASCLSTLDEIIAAQSEIIEQLKQHKKGLMQRLLPKTID